RWLVGSCAGASAGKTAIVARRKDVTCRVGMARSLGDGAELSNEPSIERFRLRVEHTRHDARELRFVVAHDVHRNLGGARLWKSVHARRERGEGDARDVALRERER